MAREEAGKLSDGSEWCLRKAYKCDFEVGLKLHDRSSWIWRTVNAKTWPSALRSMGIPLSTMLLAASADAAAEAKRKRERASELAHLAEQAEWNVSGLLALKEPGT